MWQPFNRNFAVLLFLLCTFTSFSKNDTTAYNPYFMDSVLRQKPDSAKWNKMLNVLDIQKPARKNIFIQQYRFSEKSIAFLIISLSIALLILILRLIFDDFATSLLEGVLSIKRFYIFYKSKKYDSLFAILSVYLLKITILSFLLYIGLHFVENERFTSFDYYSFLNVFVLMFLFFTLKNMTEFIFNAVIDTQETFKAFFLQNLFAEFLLSIIVLILFIIYIYGSLMTAGFMYFLLLSCFITYIVFNIIRSYQLMSNIRIPHKLHFFLYICAFKIIPLLLLAKYILNNNID